MEFQDIDSGVTGSSSALYNANDNSHSELYENFNHDVISTVGVNNDQADATRQHMYKMGSEVNEGGLEPDDNADSFFYEEYEVGDTMVSSTDNNEAYSFEVDQDTNSSFNLAHQSADHDYTAERDTFGDQADNEDVKSKEKFNVESLSYELQVGYRILSNMMSASNRCVNKLFLFPVDDNYPETSDYYEKIKEPMWMFKMKEKFESLQYKGLTDFMADFRLMIENCYRFNGPDNFVSKRAQKLETMMKQKIALLSRDLREKILGNNSEDDILTSGFKRRIRNPNMGDDPSQQLLSQLRRDRVMQEKVDRRQKVEDRKAMEQARVQELQDWEDRMLGADVKEKIRTMWELPQIGLFVYLCMESLGLEEEVTQYQLERGIALPRECSDFRRLMTCLLSTPHQRKSLKSFMPYHVWNTKLTAKIDYLYKVLADNKGNCVQACYKLGLDTRAYKMMGKSNPLLKKKFHELSFLKRVWILKNYCDFCMETQQYLQKTIDEIESVRPMDVREVLLGSDGRGYRYINFPMFTGKDIRIFKHPKTPEPSLESLAMVDWSLEVEKPSASSSRCSTPVSQKNHKAGETPSTSLRARALLQAAESKEASPLRDAARSDAAENAHQTPSSNNTDSAKVGSNKKRKRYSIFTGKRKRLKAGSRKSTVAIKSSDPCDENEDECGNNGVDSVQNADNSLVDKLDNTSELNGSVQAEEENVIKEEPRENSKTPQSAGDRDMSAMQIKLEKEEKALLAGEVKDELLKEDKENSRNDENKPVGLTAHSDVKSELSKTEPGENDEAQGVTAEDSKLKEKVKDEAVGKQILSESSSLDKVKSEEVKKEEVEEDDETDEDDLPDVGHIELVAESMEDIRQLMNKLSNPEPIKRGKRTYPGVMKPCEEELLENVTRFHEELLKYEKNLANARVSMQSKLRKEVESYVDAKIDESKGWDSDHSQTSKDSSDDEEVATKSDSDTVKQPKKVKSKQATPTTTVLLSSAASKLSSITGEGNEDSNDSFELDISSRGRLRKRRIIPNNTEDTGIKKRKNIPNQESFFTTQSSPPASSVASAVSVQAEGQPQNNNLSSDIISLLRSPQPNSAIKAQLATPTGHVLRLVAPSADGALRTVRVSAKPNMVISSQSLSNLRFITSTGVVTFPRNTITTSSTQTSHPVIQQLLLNQSRSSAQTTTKTVSSAAPRLAKPIQLQGMQTSVSGAVKLSHVISVPSSVSTLSSKMLSPQSGIQTASKQALDIGLSVTQIQQLIKSQAIQINTAAGNPATLVLTSGLQSMANKPLPPSTASYSTATNSPVQMRMQASSAVPNQQSKVPVTGVAALFSAMSRTPATQSQVLISTKNMNPLAAMSGQNLPQLIRTQSGTVVRVNTPLHTEAMNISKVVSVPSQLARFSDGTSVAGKVVPNNAAVIRQGIVRTVVTAGQKILPVPRIISSLSPLTNWVTVPSSTNIAQAPLVSSTSQVTSGAAFELAKARVINVPGMSPGKKYAGNVTVKALLENRGPKKQGEEEMECEQALDTADACESTLVSSSDYDSSIFLSTSNVQSNKIDTGLTLNSYTLSSPAVSTFIPHTLPLSVDTGISSRNITATSSEVIVPTVNIKVPSPNTLPSVLHNKNGTTIVQSTKVPIPVASETKTGDSLSPVYHQSLSAPAVNALARVSNLSGAGVVTNVSNSLVKQVSSAVASQQLPSSMATMKNVMLKVSPQTGGPGQFVQGYMTPRGIVIPQAALLQQQQGNNVIISSVSQAGNIAQVQPSQIHIQQSGSQQSFSLASQPTITQQQPPQQILINSSSASTGLYNPNPNPSLKVMFLNSTCGQSSLTTNSIISSVQQQPTNTPASELVKQLASNSHIQGHAQQSVAMSPGGNQQNSHILSNMMQGTNLQMSNSTILPRQTIVNAGVSPQLAQIFTLQQGNQIHQQPNTVVTTKPSTVQNKPAVMAVQLQQFGQILNLGGVSQVQLPQQQITSLQQHGSTGRVAQSNQVLQLAINPQVGGQTIVAAPQGPQIVRVATQLSPQNQGLSSLHPQGNIIIQQQQGQNIVLQQQAVVGNASSQQFSALQVSKASSLATTTIQTPVVGQVQNTSSLVLSQLQSPVVSTPASINQIQYVLNPSAGTQPGFTVVSSPLNKLSVGSVAGTVNKIIRADSNSTLTMLPSQGNVIGNTVRHAAALNNKGGISQMIIPNTAPGQFLISPVKLAPQAQQANMISPIKYIQNPNSVSGQASNQYVINSALSGLPAQVSVKPSVIYANQVSADKKEGKVAQILLSRPAAPGLSTSHQAGSSMSLSVAPAPATSKLSGGETGTKTILYKIGDQYFSPASNLSGLQPGATQLTRTSNIMQLAANSKPDVQLLVPPACIEASDQILKHNNTGSAANTLPSTVPPGASACPNLALNRSVSAVRNPEQAVCSVNGIHQGNAQFSFSLSGPATMNNKPSIRSDGLVMLNGQTPGNANSQEATYAPPVQLNTSKGQYSVGGDQSTQKGQPGQRLSSDEISLQEQNEKEAALNLLTFANQPI